MFRIFRKRKLQGHIKEAQAYIRKTYKYEKPFPNSKFSMAEPDEKLSENRFKEEEPKIYYSSRNGGGDEEPAAPQIRYSKKSSAESFDEKEVTCALRGCSGTFDNAGIQKVLEKNVNQSFVDKLLEYIEKKGVRDSKIYKAANVDKRLFSKMATDRQYKPSKDTAVAFALALELSLEEANDLLSRAGYVLSHSSKRDIIIEYFFKEKIYNLLDANEILYQLDQKVIGRI